jgi:hypothetical protein
MRWTLYPILHIAGILFLTGTVFAVFGGAPDSRRKLIMMVGGILSLLVLVSGFGLAARKLDPPYPAGLPLWLWVKVICWLWLSAVAGLAYRRRHLTPLWMGLTIGALLTALCMVFLKPGG